LQNIVYPVKKKYLINVPQNGYHMEGGAREDEKMPNEMTIPQTVVVSEKNYA
jgi:hypothetical protein